jgi:hypothetical protein
LKPQTFDEFILRRRELKSSKVFLVLASLLFSLLPQTASADTLNDCRIPASEWNIVSLGFPMRSERLAKIKNPKILILNFQLKGEPVRVLTQDEKNTFSLAIQDIKDFSSNQNLPELIYSPPIEIPYTSSDLDEIKINVPKTWGTDFSNSTYGFVEKVIKFADPIIDYRGIDAVVLYGKAPYSRQEIAEAMMFTSGQMRTNNAKRADGANWFDPLKTNEGLISNVSLLYNRNERNVITHELMHLYGLIDLYGSNAGPGVLSLMERNLLNLLTYEKWILGWHPDNQVKCLSKIQTTTPSAFSLEFKSFKEIMVITTSTGANYVVETLEHQGKPTLAFYTVENDRRPPLTLYKDSQSRSFSDIQLATPDKIGAQLIAPELTLLISDIDSEKVTLNLIGSSQTSSTQFQGLISTASTKKDARLTEIAESEKRLAEAKAAAELKAKQDAEAKAAAELKAKAAADLKAQQEAAAKAAATKKKTTITCVKGKTTKKVTAVSPKCPSGFKKK